MIHKDQKQMTMSLRTDWRMLSPSCLLIPLPKMFKFSHIFFCMAKNYLQDLGAFTKVNILQTPDVFHAH